jgi:hypothetical protein
MTYYNYEFFDHEWQVTNEGVISVSNKPVKEHGTHTFVVHGIAVSAKFEEDVEANKKTMLSGGVLCLVVCDAGSHRRVLYLSKDNLHVDKEHSAADGKFMFSMLQVLKKSNDPILSKLFWGTFCWCGCLWYETSFCGLPDVVCARVWRLVFAFVSGSGTRWQQDADRNSTHY